MNNSKPTCRDVFTHICTNLDQGIDSAECKALKLHLDGCPDCVTYLETLKETGKLYREYPVPRLTKQSRQKLLSVLESYIGK